ncbi:MAG: hypothetical protein GEU98_21080 [Pseudonocardiaceae bacterium]|nr:hypothetical protein [Pseudonocardiaceae bacterium]
MTGPTDAHAAELVLRDLVDTLIQENLSGFADRLRQGAAVEPGAERWCYVQLDRGALVFRGRHGGALQEWRLSLGPVWSTVDGSVPRVVDAAELVRLVIGDETDAAHAAGVAEELRCAAEHASTTSRGRAELDVTPRPGSLLAGERIAATRGRPFHPTARAATGWNSAELAGFGPMRPTPFGLDWVAVRRDRLRHGGGARSDRLHESLLSDDERLRLEGAMALAGVRLDEYQPLPVHPWQFERVLPDEYAEEFAAREVVPVTRDLGAFRATASLRTLLVEPESPSHVKLPLGISTLGATRLLPPRYLDNGERAQRTVATLLERDEALAERVAQCDERDWCGWRGPSDVDEFDDRPGQLAAQLRGYPAGVLDGDALAMPMAALAAHEWDTLGRHIGDPVAFFRELAESFCDIGFGFLRYGVLPELHGQNVVAIIRSGTVQRFVLRDHDTVRLYPKWMAEAGVPDPGYRIKPGAAQSLRLDSGRELLGYLQTLGFQVNLYGIADALSRRYAIDERVFWTELRAAISVARLDGEVADVVRRELLDVDRWPSRQVLGPLLRAGRSTGVSMPAATGQVPNPLRAPARVSAERAARTRLLNAYLRETGQPRLSGARLELPMPAAGSVLSGDIRYRSVSGHHEYGDEFRLGGRVVGHAELVDLLLSELAAASGQMPGSAAEQIEHSVTRTARYLADHPPNDVYGPTRHAEQSVLLGHPMHPIPKGAHGFTDDDLAAYAPELGAAFRLSWYAVAPELVAEEQITGGAWQPPGLVDTAWPLLPVHPWQARYLEARTAVRKRMTDGSLVPLGPLGPEVYPTSSVRTVADPSFQTCWKLPLHVRITNFVRTNPEEHVRRAMDASTLIATARERWRHPGFRVLLETGYRSVRDDELASELSVLYRENLFANRGDTPRVLASLLEDRMNGAEPGVLAQVREAVGCPEGPIPIDRIAEWLRSYLAISLVPLLSVFASDGVSLEAHTQNSLLHTEGGWPVRYYVRDMEGASVSRARCTAVPPGSPLLYDDSEAWLRLRYNVITNHLGQLVHVLGRAGTAEPQLWRVVRESLRAEAPPELADELLAAPTLPAKANLFGWFTGRQERPHYVPIPNPLCGGDR